MKLYTPRRNQGQIVVVSYGYDETDYAYRHTVDRSEPLGSPDRETWERGELDWDREPEGIDYDRVPCVLDWEPCAAPRKERE